MNRATIVDRLEAFSASFELLATIKKVRELGVEGLQDAEDQIREFFHETLAGILAAVLEVLPDQEAAESVATSCAKSGSPPTLEFKLYDPEIDAPEIGRQCIVALKIGPTSGAVTDGNIRTAKGWQKGQDPWTPRGDVWWCYSPDVTTWASTTTGNQREPQGPPADQVAVDTLEELRGLRADVRALREEQKERDRRRAP